MMNNAPEFTDIVDVYEILILAINDYRGSTRQLSGGLCLAAPDQCHDFRKSEYRALRRTFEDWPLPYCGRLPGFREDSPILVLFANQIVAGVYLCDKNEFEFGTNYGQLHYAFVSPEYKGLGIYSVLFREAVLRANDWGLSHLFLNSDRHMLPEVYLKWGATRWKTSHKQHSSRWAKHSILRPFRDIGVEVRNHLLKLKTCR